MSEPSYTECGRVVVDANEWDRLKRLDAAVTLLRPLERGDICFTNATAWIAWCDVTKELK